jgi:hypothetical protein
MHPYVCGSTDRRSSEAGHGPLARGRLKAGPLPSSCASRRSALACTRKGGDLYGETQASSSCDGKRGSTGSDRDTAVVSFQYLARTIRVPGESRTSVAIGRPDRYVARLSLAYALHRAPPSRFRCAGLQSDCGLRTFCVDGLAAPKSKFAIDHGATGADDAIFSAIRA